MSIEFTKIKHDSNGNPRYVCHFFNLLTEKEKNPEAYQLNGILNHISPISSMYQIAVKRANKIGGRKYHTKAYGGGIVFQSYNLADLEKSILELVNDTESK